MDKSKVAAVFLLALVSLGAGVDRIRIASAFTDPTSGVRAQDESTYAHSAIQMARSGGWMTPQLLGRFYTQKPPLLMWLTALSVKSFGLSLLDMRLPALLAGAVAVALVFLWVRQARSTGAAVTGACCRCPADCGSRRWFRQQPLRLGATVEWTHHAIPVCTCVA